MSHFGPVEAFSDGDNHVRKFLAKQVFLKKHDASGWGRENGGGGIA